MEKWHGRMVAREQFAVPDRVVECNSKARPEYHDIPSHEYRDRPEVLHTKIQILAQLVRQAKKCVAYTGAGLSVSSGLADYATKAHASVQSRYTVDSRYLAEPNVGHKVLARLCEHGWIQRIFNQNHDGLLQKAGLPQDAVNEIHGAFFDPSNPGGFELRGDLVEDMFQWADKTDLCLALGTSLSGLNADRLARSPAQRYSQQDGCLGLVIVSLQETQLDKLSTLRIFAELDYVMQALSEELQLPFAVAVPLAKPPTLDLFSGLPYDAVGQLQPNASTTLDLRPGSRVQVTNGNFAGCCGIVAGKNPQGHYLLTVTMDVGEGASIKEDLLLGSWFPEEARLGRLATLPIVQALPYVAKCH